MAYAVVIPVNNEAEHIENIVKELLQLNVGQIIVVDDGSSDDTLDRLKKIHDNHLVLLAHRTQQGKYKTVLDGLKKAGDAKAVILMDGDGQHQPKDIPALIESYEKGHDAVFGVRDLSEAPWTRKFANHIVQTNLLIYGNSNVPDAMSGFRLFSKEIVDHFIGHMHAGPSFNLEFDEILFISRMEKPLKIGIVPVDVLYEHDADGKEIKSHMKPKNIWKLFVSSISLGLELRKAKIKKFK